MLHRNWLQDHDRRSNRGTFIPIVAAVTLALLSLPGLEAQSAQPTEDLPPGPMQVKATASCQECHEARIILQQRLSKAAWTKEVDKMIKWGAVVDTGDHDALIEYLSANFGTDKPPYQPPRSAPESRSSAGGTKRK